VDAVHHGEVDQGDARGREGGGRQRRSRLRVHGALGDGNGAIGGFVDPTGAAIGLWEMGANASPRRRLPEAGRSREQAREGARQEGAAKKVAKKAAPKKAAKKAPRRSADSRASSPSSRGRDPSARPRR